MIKTLSFLSFFLFTMPIYGETYCEKRESRGEGDWPVSEESFTKDKAKRALEYFSTYIEKNSTSTHPPEPEDMMHIDNEWMMIKGYVFKQILSEYKPNNEIQKEDIEFIRKQFCEFIENEAYVRH